MQQLISVIVPVYNVERYLEKCLKSLVCQTYKNLEIIIVDDGSSDASSYICDKYAQEYAYVSTFHKKNGGQSSARNYGVKKATSEWIVFVDSDDWVESTYIENLWKLKETYQADMSIARVVREKEDGSDRPTSVQFEIYCTNAKDALWEIYTGERVGWGPYGKLIKKSALLKHPFPNGYYEDYACTYKLLEECEKIAIGNFETDYHYIDRVGSTLRSKLKEEHFHVFNVCDEFKNYINKNYPDLNVLTIIAYRMAVTQMLNCQFMSWGMYRKVYNKYRPLFVNNLKIVLNEKKLSKKQKYFMLIHCLTPEIFKLQRMILLAFRKIRGIFR